MRWQYRSPREKLFLSDGKDAWFYVPGERQVRRTAVKKLDDLRSPLAFLLGKTKLEKELQALSLASDVAPLAPEDVVLRGVPKSLADRVSQVLLEITPEHWISRIIIEEVDGSVTEYRFTNQRENVAVTDQQFQFAVPDGVEVIDGELGNRASAPAAKAALFFRLMVCLKAYPDTNLAIATLLRMDVCDFNSVVYDASWRARLRQKSLITPDIA